MMSDRPSLAAPVFDEARERPGFNCRRARLGRQAGWREMAEGEVASFRVGEEGAHQIVNRTSETVRFLAFSNQQPDIMVRPDSGSVSVVERRPEGGGLSLNFRVADSVGYFDLEPEEQQ